MTPSMKAAVFVEPGRISLEERPFAPLSDTEVYPTRRCMASVAGCMARVPT